jgi:sorting nexin-1/2
MDTFDDLLEPSRRALEINPFEDPFAKRSNSPDPWSTFAHQPVSPIIISDSQALQESEYEAGSGTTPTGSFVTAERAESVEESASIGSPDPLDAATQQHVGIEEYSVPDSGSRSPGFMESIPPTFSEIETIRPSLPEELEPSIPAPSFFESTSLIPPTSSNLTKPVSSSSSTSVGSSSPSASTFARVTSPLDSPANSGIARSFADLALGGESVGAWQGAQSSWASPHIQGPGADDSDDDKPIRQANRLSEPQAPSPVRPFVLFNTVDYLFIREIVADGVRTLSSSQDKKWASTSICYIC